MDSLHTRLRGRILARRWSVLPLSVTTSAMTSATLALCLLAALLFGSSLAAKAQEDKQGDVIVQFDDHAQVVRSFTFTGAISGLDALALSGLDVVTTSTSFGPAVCSIAGVGCPSTDCFCSATKYWAYNYWDGAAWQGYPVGAGSSVISQTGVVEGWRWGEFGTPQAPAPAALAAAAALDWLAARQVITDGGYGSAGATVETMLAIGANGLAAGTWQAAPGTPTLADAALGTVAAYTRGGAGASGKGIAGLVAAEMDLPPLTAQPSQAFSATLGVYSVQSGPNALALLGTLAQRQEPPPGAVAGLAAQVLPGGGWEWAPGWGADTNATALAVQALLAGGQPLTSTVIAAALAYLHGAQNGDGGFAYSVAGSTPGTSDANSTAYVVQALVAAGQDVRSAAWQVGGRGPIDYLLSLQAPDGSFAWQAGQGTNLLATQQVIPALLARTQPIWPLAVVGGQDLHSAAYPALLLPEIRR